ncbi:MAG: metallophosphoesterase [Actinomycetota bacterium]
MDEVIAVGPRSATLFSNGTVRHLTDLLPSTSYVDGGLSFETGPDLGDLLSVVVTMNDVHFGELECGKINGSTNGVLSVAPGTTPYPERMNTSACEDALGLKPDAVVVKGDLTSFGTLEEFGDFRRCYEMTFGNRLTYVRGNHDSFPGLDYASWPVQLVDVPGLRIVLLDTSRQGEVGGFLDAEQLTALSTAARSTSSTVIVMGHHPIVLPEVSSDGHRNLNPSDSQQLLGVMLSHPNVVAYAAGHTHRCRKIDVEGIAMVEVASVKDFPGAFAEYQVYEKGIVQLIHRASSKEAVEWAERTRDMFAGLYGPYAMGTLADRSFTLPRRRS